jgi:tetratricopeptide (TPR) repeat protein
MLFVILALIQIPAIEELRRTEDWEILHTRAMRTTTEAEPIYERLIEAAAAHQYPPFLRGKAHNNYAALLHRTGRYALAIEQYQVAKTFWKQAYGENSDELATTLNNLAEAARLAGQLDAAQEFYEQSLMMRTALDQRSTLKQATTLGNLATLYRLRGRLEQALEAGQKAMAIRQKHLPAGHGDLANGHNTLASIYQDLGRLDEAEAAYQQALRIREMGPEGEGLVTALNNLGTLLRRKRDFEPAQRALARAEEMGKRLLGADHPTMAAIWSNLAELEMLLGRLERADTLYRQALGISEAKLGQAHPQTVTILDNLGALFLRQEKGRGAETLFRRALAVDPGNRNTRHHLAQALLLQQRFTEAETVLTVLLAEMKDDPAQAAAILTELTGIYLVGRDFGRAEAALAEATALSGEAGPEVREVIAETYQAAARMLRGEKRKRDADRLESLGLRVR